MGPEVDRVAKLLKRLGDLPGGDADTVARDVQRSAMMYANIIVRDCLVAELERCLQMLRPPGDVHPASDDRSGDENSRRSVEASAQPSVQQSDERIDPTEHIVLNLIDRGRVRRAATTKSLNRNLAIPMIAELIDQAHPEGLAAHVIAKHVVPKIVGKTVLPKVLTFMKESAIINSDDRLKLWFVAGQAPPSERQRSHGVEHQVNGASP